MANSSLLTGCVLSLSLLAISPDAQSAACTSFKARDINSAKLELYRLEGGKITPFKTLKKSEVGLPITLEDCPQLSKYFIWRERGAILVEKAKFKCVATRGTGQDRTTRPGGVPGSGSSNIRCEE